MYAVTYDGRFGTVNIADGSFKQIGLTGITCSFYTSLLCDPTTGKMYTTTLTGGYPNFVIGLYSIDHTTGVGTLVANSSHTGTAAQFAFDKDGKFYAIEHRQVMNGLLYSMLLARADGIPQRFYSMSSQIRAERKRYYGILEKTQKGSLDITKWLNWFLSCLQNALDSSNSELEKVIYKHKFWNKNSSKLQNKRQELLLTKLLDGFDGTLTSSKWAKIAKCSADTALRDIQDLMSKGILKKSEGGGRSTSYEINEL